MAVCGLIGHRAISLTQLMSVLRPVRYAPAYIQELIEQVEGNKQEVEQEKFDEYSKIG